MDTQGLLIDICESTNDELKRRTLSGDARPGHWIRARNQTHGRGRHGNHWLGGEGNLFFSQLLETPASTPLTWIPLLCAFSVRRVLANHHPDLELFLKWPNDLLVALPNATHKKIAGILCESFSINGRKCVIAGVGINVVDAPIPQSASIAEVARETPVSVDLLAQDLSFAITRGLERLRLEGPAFIADEYAHFGEFREGDHIQWTDNGRIQSGLYRGLGPYGEMIISSPSGVNAILSADQISKTTKLQN